MRLSRKFAGRKQMESQYVQVAEVFRAGLLKLVRSLNAEIAINNSQLHRAPFLQTENFKSEITYSALHCS